VVTLFILTLGHGRFVHVQNDSFDGDVANGLFEKQLLNCLRRDGAQRGQQEQQLAEAKRLRGIGVGVVFAQGQLGLILKGDYVLEIF
jgi:hypothetical protein